MFLHGHIALLVTQLTHQAVDLYSVDLYAYQKHSLEASDRMQLACYTCNFEKCIHSVLRTQTFCMRSLVDITYSRDCFFLHDIQPALCDSQPRHA